MKSLVVMTYYQLMHAIALALTFEEKPNLYFSMSYLDPKEEFLDRIRESGVFHTVTGITRRGENREFLIELRKTEGATDQEIQEIGDSLFEQYLEPHYAELFKDADPEDEMIVYNDFRLHYYYISKHFPNIVGAEDGYCSLPQQLTIQIHQGTSVLLAPFIRLGYYPEPLYRFRNVRKIISSRDFEELDDFYREKLQVWDLKDIIAQSRGRFREAMSYIFDLEELHAADRCNLIIGQPLDRVNLCSPLENYFLNKVYVREALKGASCVYMKPHPAEKSDSRIYAVENVEVLPKDFPVELLNYQDVHFSKVFTFSSTGSSMITCADEQVRFFNRNDASREEVLAFIRDMIKGEKLEIDLFLRVRDMTPERYVAVYSWIFLFDLVHTNLHLVGKNEDLEAFRRYYDPKVMEKRIEEYRKQKDGTREQDLWNMELLRLKSRYDKYKPGLDFCGVSALDDRTVFEEAIRGNYDYDYMMLLDVYKPAFTEMRRLFDGFEKKMPSAIYFALETEYSDDKGVNKKVSIDPGYLERSFNGQLPGRMFHRELVRELAQGPAEEVRFAEIINGYASTIQFKPAISLYVTKELFPDAEHGEEYYRERVKAVVERYREDPEYTAGQLAHLLYEYYIWARVSGAVNTKYASLDTLEELIDDREVLYLTYRKLGYALLFQEALRDNNLFYQESYFYRGMKSNIDKAADEGMFTKIDNLRRAKKKLRRIIRK